MAGRFYALLRRLWGLPGGVSAQGARQGSQSGNAASLRGFRTSLRIGAIGRFYALLRRLRGLRGESLGGCGGEDGLPGGPGGEFRGLRRRVCLVTPAAARRSLRSRVPAVPV